MIIKKKGVIFKYMNFDQTKKEVEQTGYIKIIFEPANGKDGRFEKKEIQELLDKSTVSLRGWSFPMMSKYNSPDKTFCVPYNIENGKEFYSNFDDRKEVGRFYSSGQFVYEFSLLEDYRNTFNGKEFTKGEYLDFLSTIYKITEIVLFIKKLIENSDIEGGRLEIGIHGVKNRKLEPIFSHQIFGFHDAYVSMVEKATAFSIFTREQILENSESISRKMIVKIFEDFNCNDISESVIETHQDNLINRRF